MKTVIVKSRDGTVTSWTYAYAPPLKNPLQWAAWAFLGNDDQGMDYRGVHPVRWWLSNPMHNLMRYIVGVGRPSRWTFPQWIGVEKHEPLDYRPHHPETFKDIGWFWLRWRWRKDYMKHPTSIIPCGLWLPFYSGKRFYIGWRGDGALALRIKP